jgi:C1A family cysteine protease
MLRPVIIGMDVYESFESDIVAKTGKMPMPSDSEECLGEHSVLIVGYIDAPKTFKTTKGCSKK